MLFLKTSITCFHIKLIKLGTGIRSRFDRSLDFSKFGNAEVISRWLSRNQSKGITWQMCPNKRSKPMDNDLVV